MFASARPVSLVSSLVASLVFGGLVALTPGAAAKSWCAYPLYVHEWGVQAFRADGAAATGTALPAWFHGPGQTLAAAPRTPVRALPADSGDRDLPVLHFYSPRGGVGGATIPVGLEVGFTLGAATRWFPDVDRLGPQGRGPQLSWDRLELSHAPAAPPTRTDIAWVARARALDALWVQSARASERFVFYEAATRERVPLTIRRGATWAPGRRHLELVNTGRHAVHDVLFVHREGRAAYVFSAPAIPAGQSAGFIIEAHAPDDIRAATHGALVAALVDPTQPTPPTTYRWDHDQCVMMRDPAVPEVKARGHRLYQGEVELMLGVWGERFFERQGTTLVYREDPAYLDEVMPLAVYTDMYNFVVLHRAGLAVWSDITLP